MSLNELLKSLQCEYLADLPERIETIHAHFESQNISALVEDFHKLKGTGKTYGFPKISELGERMEALLVSAPPKGLNAVPEALAELVHIHSESSSDMGLPVAS